MELKYYIGHSTDQENRYLSSSGGIGSELIKYLMECCGYGTSMTFEFNKEECRYNPKIIYNYEDYNNCGSIYQDTDTIKFIRDNISNIRGGIIVSCMPCQVKAIKSILGKYEIRNFIISLCCSGQTTVQGTWCYYKLLGIKKEEVACIQYRGKGWPSGIQITLKSGESIMKDNYTYPWTLMHESLLFRPIRCLHCAIKTSEAADVSLADPWLKEYIEEDNIGSSIIISNEKATEVINNMVKEKLIEVIDIDENTYVKSQRGTIRIKRESASHKKYNKIVGKMGKEGSLYKTIMASSEFSLKLHSLILRFLKRML